ncbi:MAG: NitT/TauT family transport system substrate-binding protein [Solirubrobacteraceae bacterium]|jgi:NitT/TauT family transport system substrate-binding protein|nr:NitT/TauT family transport system substrate-binding protein [Solirubrobacteraceae bacterium]
MRLRRHRLAASAAATVAVLAVAGCGGSAGGGASSGNASGGGSGAVTLTVQETAGVPSAFVAFGIAKGFFDRHRLKVDLQSAQGGAATVPALVSGKIQVGGSNVVSLLIAAAKGLPIQAIAPGTSAHGANEKDFGALMVAKDSPIRHVADLEGRTVAVNTLNNIAEVVVRASLQKAGVDASKVKLSEVDFPEMGPALAKGDVDAAFAIEPFVTIARRDGDRIIDYSYVSTEPGLQVGAYAVSRRFARESPGVVRRFRAAVGQTATYLMAHQDEFRAFLSERAKTPARLARTMQLPTFTTTLDTASMQRTARLVRRYGLVTEPVSVGDLVGAGGA